MDFDLESALSRLKAEFVDTSKDRLDEVDAIINSIYEDENSARRGEMFFELQRTIHSIKGSSGTHGLRVVSVIAHRLEDYLEASQRLNKEQWLDVQKFVDAMRGLFDQGEDPDQTVADMIISGLPTVQKTLKVDDVSAQDARQVVVLVVMPKGVIRKMIGKELHSCGFDISFADEAETGMSLALSLEPDMIISNYDFPKVNGLELANALNCIERTRAIPFALASSHGLEHFKGNSVPENASIIRKDSKMLESLTEFMMVRGFFGEV